jgi:hypothetical protein
MHVLLARFLIPPSTYLITFIKSNLFRNRGISNQREPFQLTILILALVLHTSVPDPFWKTWSHPHPGIYFCRANNSATIYCIAISITVVCCSTNRSKTSTTLEYFFRTILRDMKNQFHIADNN